MILRRVVFASAGSLGLGIGGWNLSEDPDFIAGHQAVATQHWVETEDGAWVWMQRYEGDGPAVVLCHGISSNHHFWDLAPGRSLALYLHEQGYDVWNLDLRGHGPARHAPEGKRQKAGWTVDDYGRFDLPAAFSYVQEATGDEGLHYVGHSMGGMVLAVYLSQNAETPLHSAVAVGSPLDFRDPDVVTGFALSNTWATSGMAFIPTPMGAGLVAGMRKAPLGIDARLFNPSLVDPAARELMYERIVSPMSRGELGQFGKTARTGEFSSADGEVAYRTALGRVTVPMRFLAGRADRIAAADRVYGYYDAVGSEDKDYVVLSEANGFRGDYGHLDPGVGDFAELEVYPVIEDWIGRHR